MFGNVISVSDLTIKLENISKRVETSLLGVHIVFENKYKIVAEITSITREEIECIMVGEFINNVFNSGIVHKPSHDSKVRIINSEEVISLVGKQDVDTKTDLYVGKSLIYDGFNVSANIDNFFSNHFAIIGNTGSGKSCSVARLFQNLYYRQKYVPINSNIVLFDVYGEYKPALDRINQTKYCRCKHVTTDVRDTVNSDIVKIPPYYLEVDDLALLLNVDTPSQIPIIEKALKLVYLFTEDEDKVIAHKNNIIAKAILDILTGGKESTQIRDQVIAVLSTFHTKDINLESKIVQPGYIRTLRQCLNVDQTGKINTIQLVMEYLDKFTDTELKLENSMKPQNYTLKDLYNAFEFALISEGVLKSDKVYDMNNILKVRLDAIINSDYGRYFEVDEYIPKETYIRDLFTTRRGEKAQIINFNLNYVDERFAKTLTKIYSKLFLDYAISLESRGGFPLQIILEEAHRYVQNDDDVRNIGYNIFDRITKEGRKYGVVLGLITQRPSELSNTALSQCSNYIVLRMFHPEDLKIIKSMTHSIAEEDIEKLKALRPGVALCFGNAFNIPVFVKIDKPDPTPDSNNAHIGTEWFKEPSEILKEKQLQAQKNTIEIQ
jgi:DNA helicase HerA-like ATPase